MPEIENRELADLPLVIFQADALVENPWRLIDAGDALEFNPPPRRRGGSIDRVDELLGSAAQRHKLNPALIEATEIRIRREPGIENEFLRIMPGPLLPEVDEPQHFIDLRVFPHLGVGVAEHAGAGIPREKRQDPLLAPGALGHIVFFDERVLAVERNRME